MFFADIKPNFFTDFEHIPVMNPTDVTYIALLHLSNNKTYFISEQETLPVPLSLTIFQSFFNHHPKYHNTITTSKGVRRTDKKYAEFSEHYCISLLPACPIC